MSSTGPVRRTAARALAAIKAAPAAFHMNQWTSKKIGPTDDPASCGTTLCVAGWVVHQAGFTIENQHGDVFLASGKRDHVYTLARDLLGLTDEQALYLFHESEGAALGILEEIAETGVFPPGIELDDV